MSLKRFTVKDVLDATGGCYSGPQDALENVIDAVTTDSREVKKGGLFAAIKGARSNGHDYIPSCYEKGVALCIGEREIQDSGVPYIRVESTMKALADLAAWYRTLFDIPVVGITGSVGKTTTKEMIWAVLSQRFKTHKTQMNFNNELGVPLTILSMQEDTEAAVIEMGISGFGEMTRLRRIVQPTIALISIIGDSHLEFLGSREGVLKAKAEIFQDMTEKELAILNGDDALLCNYDPGIPTVYYGIEKPCEVCAWDIRSLDNRGVACNIGYDHQGFDVVIPGYGLHLVYAALAATAVGRALWLTEKQIKDGIEHFETVGRRSNIIRTDSLTIIDDCYNANPSSTKAMLQSLALTKGRRVCILGDMLELGERSDMLHDEVGREAARQRIDLVIACGKEAEHIYEGAKAYGAEAVWFARKDELLEKLEELLEEGDTVLVKASHSCRFEEITEKLQALVL